MAEAGLEHMVLQLELQLHWQ